jgi:hypothetical protein
MKSQFAGLVLVALAPLAAASAEEQGTKWSAVQVVGPQKDCFDMLSNERWSLVEKDGVLTASMNGVKRWSISTRSLNSDGSGRVNTKDANGRPAWFEFEPGRGPRKIRYNVGYRACVWLLNPV